MKSKNLLNSMIILFTAMMSYAQIQDSKQAPNYAVMPGSYGFNEPANSSLIEITNPKKVKGSPFLLDESVPAQLIFDNPEEDVVNINLNYNAYVDFMIIEDEDRNENDEVELLPRAHNFDILMDGKRFRYINFIHDEEEINSYVEILDSFEDGSFLALKRSKKIFRNGRRKKYIDTETFYFITNKGKALRLENDDKKILNDLPENKKADVASYITEKNIEFDKSYRGIKGVARYYAGINTN